MSGYYWRCRTQALFAENVGADSAISVPRSPSFLGGMIETVEELPEAQILAELRRVRFSRGVACPRCGCRRVHRWGSFSNRQRYRCCGCRRTFSDLTGTPAVYTKKLALWSAHARCLADAVSVRRAAKRIGVHPSTAFRWRHAVHGWLHVRDNETLHGSIEFLQVWLPESRKGERNLDRQPRRRGVESKHLYRIRKEGPLVAVRIGCDRFGHVIAAPTPGADDLDELCSTFRGRIHDSPLFTIERDRLGMIARFARESEVVFVDAHLAEFRSPRSLASAQVVNAYVRRWVAWMERFRGVATKYLPNYLHWHRLYDLPARHGLMAAVLRWPAGPGFG